MPDAPNKVDPGAPADVAVEFAESTDQYKVKLPDFEGPLDLLLFLIRKEEVSIYDIPIARITAQYLEYLTAMRELDISVAGEFLVMAATLIHIKSQMLLPRDPDTPEDALEDPRAELVYQLLEHQKFKGAANALHQRALIEAATFTRGGLETDDENPEVSSTVFQLFEVFRDVLTRQRAVVEMEIAREQVTMAEKIAQIRTAVAEQPEVSARRMFEQAGSRREMVLIFLAILEMVKELAIRLKQSETFGDIVISKRVEIPDEATEGPTLEGTETPAETASSPTLEVTEAEVHEQEVTETPIIEEEVREEVIVAADEPTPLTDDTLATSVEEPSSIDALAISEESTPSPDEPMPSPDEPVPLADEPTPSDDEPTPLEDEGEPAPLPGESEPLSDEPELSADESMSPADEVIESTSAAHEPAQETDEPTLSADESTSLTDELAPSADEPVPVADEYAPSAHPSISSVEELAGITDKPALATDEPALLAEEFTRVTDEPMPSAAEEPEPSAERSDITAPVSDLGDSLPPTDQGASEVNETNTESTHQSRETF